MAEGFEPYHVPQQSRRDKLRVIPASAQLLSHAEPPPPPSLHGLMMLPPAPPYDHHPLIISSAAAASSPSDLLTSSKDHHNSNNLMALVGSSSSTSSSSNFRNPYSTASLDPQFHGQNMLAPSFLYGAPSQIIANLHHSRDDHHDHQDVVVFKPEPLSLSLSSYDNHSNSISDFAPGNIFGPNDGVSRAGPVPLGPFTGYATVLKGSRFLRPAQQLLEEFCNDVVGGASSVICAEKLEPDSSLMMMDTNAIVDDDDDGDLGDDHDDDDHDHVSGSEVGGEIRKKKSSLISMLDEVYRRYKQYYQQMQAVVTSFEYVAGLGNAAPYANLAVKAMTRHFRCLKNAIMDQLQFTSKDNNAHPIQRKDEAPILIRSINRGFFGQRPIHGSGFLEHQPVWRPQRGLPERAVTVLRAWLFEHFLHPYPTDTDKLMLAKQTGLSRSQVSNWFINARVRLWKPMVEEIHTLEMREAQKVSQRDQDPRNGSHMRPSVHIPSASTSLASENPSTSTHKNIPDTTTSSKRSRNELPSVPVGSHEDMNLTYDNLASHLQVGPAGMNMAGGSNGVSLTLGLHQNNNGLVLSEPFPINAAQRFGLGLDGNSADGYVMSTFEVQNRLFGRDVIGGQLLHDFVG